MTCPTPGITMGMTRKMIMTTDMISAIAAPL
jgi:hypothetical protein